jgi:zinc transporter ZupT
MPGKNVALIIFISLIVFAVACALVESFASHLSLLKTLMVTSITFGAAVVGAIIGWLVLKKLYPHLRNKN